MDQKPILIYLAGPIDDVSPEMALEWRTKIAREAPLNVAFFSPAHAYRGVSTLTASAIDHVNRHVIACSSGVLANLSGLGRGFGTIREIEFARARSIPVAVAGRIDSLLSFDVFLAATPGEALIRLVEAITDQRAQPQHFIVPGAVIRLDPEQDDE